MATAEARQCGGVHAWAKALEAAVGVWVLGLCAPHSPAQAAACGARGAQRRERDALEQYAREQYALRTRSPQLLRGAVWWWGVAMAVGSAPERGDGGEVPRCSLIAFGYSCTSALCTFFDPEANCTRTLGRRPASNTPHAHLDARLPDTWLPHIFERSPPSHRPCFSPPAWLCLHCSGTRRALTRPAPIPPPRPNARPHCTPAPVRRLTFQRAHGDAGGRDHPPQHN